VPRIVLEVKVYDPQALGARCDICPLRGRETVAPDLRTGVLAVVSPYLTPHDVTAGAPLMDGLGREVERSLQGTGETAFSRHTAVACYAPEPYREFVQKLERDNRKRRSAGVAEIPYPHVCCAPRLRAEVASAPVVLALGIGAYGALTGERATLANVVYARRFARVMASDVRRAVAWMHNRLPWTEPTITFLPRVDANGRGEYVGDGNALLGAIAHFLATPRDLWCFDVETSPVRWDGATPLYDPLDDRLRCIGIGDRDHALVIGLVRTDGTPLWAEEGERRLASLVLTALDDGRLIVGHNAGSYDKLTLRAWARRCGLPEPRLSALFDTLMAARVVEPELPKGLGFCASVYMDEATPAWKADHTATEAGIDEELWQYNGLDVVINARLAPILARRVSERTQSPVLTVDHAMQHVTVGLHEMGLGIDHTARIAWDRKLTETMDAHEREIRDALHDAGIAWDSFRGGATFNANSPYHAREVLFERFDLPLPGTLREKEIFTATGDRSTGKAVYNAYLGDPQTPPQARRFLEAHRRWKKAAKLRGTYIVKADPTHPRSVVHPVTGRVHAEWKAHATLVGRMACAGPNLLNQPKKLRNMYRAQPGCVYVGADWSALHLYIIAMRWGIPSLLEAFTRGLDAHALFAGVVFGDRFWQADGLPDGPRGTSGEYSGNAGKMRSVTKTVRYAGAYMAAPQTIWRVVRATENKAGELPYASMPMRSIEGIHAAWMKGEPEWQQAWEAEIAEWRAKGFKTSAILGRRCDFADGLPEDSDADLTIANALVNYPILATEADIANIVTTELVEALPFGYAGPGTGLVQQNYDSILLEVPEHDAKRVAGILHDAMNRRFPALGDLTFKADVQIGHTWDQV
jgi:DNA polymerase I-like protein with 3'-5' exonuclease and polymerase domains